MTTSSWSTKKRGACNRTSKFLRVVTSVSPWPTLVPSPMAQVLIFQPVRLSGILNRTSACPEVSVVIDPAQKAVSAKFERIVGCGSSAPAASARSAWTPKATPLASAIGGAASAKYIMGKLLRDWLSLPRMWLTIPLPPPPPKPAAAKFKAVISSIPPNTPKSFIGISPFLSRLPNERSRVHSRCGW